MGKPWRVVVVGSGLAGLSCAERLLCEGASVSILTPGYLGRDGATQRVHLLAPWIVLNAPCLKGDSPERYLEDLKTAGEGEQRPGLTEVFAAQAPATVKELVRLLELQPLAGGPVLLPGNSFPRAQRFVPKKSGLLLGPLVSLVASRAQVHERAAAVGLALQGERVCGVWAFHRTDSKLHLHDADAVVLACGGVGAIFGPSTVPRWCRGSALALASKAGALLHKPHLTQALPVLPFPPGYFPTTSALLKAQVWVEGEPLSPVNDLPTLTQLLAQALRENRRVWMEIRDEHHQFMPPWVRELAQRFQGQCPLTVRVHHGVGGVAIDSWGRTSVPGLYACGEAAGGVQGLRRLLGTGLLEARIFGLRAAHAVVHDLLRIGPAGAGERVSNLLESPLDADLLESQIDRWLGPLMVIRPKDEVASSLAALSTWPTKPSGTTPLEWQAAIRLKGAQILLGAELGAVAEKNGEDTYVLAGRGKL